MDKALKLGQVSATGSFQLFIGKILSTVILAVGTIILGMLISEGDYGLFTIALVPAATILLFQDWGVGSAMTKYCASYRALNKEGELRKIIVAGLTFEIATGLVLMVFSFLSANFIASAIFNKPESSFLIFLISISILFNALFMVSQNIFVGFDKMGLSSVAMICQAIAQGVLSPLLVYLGYGALGAAVGYAMSSLVVGVVAVVLLYFFIFRKLGPSESSKSNVYQVLKPLLRFGVPLAVGSIIIGILSQFNWFVVARFVDVAMIGNFRIANNFAVFLTFVTIPISTVLFPAFSKLDPKNERELLKTVFTSSVKYTALFLVPTTMALMVLSKPMIGTIYGGKWLDAPYFLFLGVISSLFTIFGNLSSTSLLTAMGETKMLMKANALVLFIDVPVALLLIPKFGVPGAIFTGIIAGIPAWFVFVYWTWKRFGAKADFQSSARIFLSSALAGGATYLFLSLFDAANWMRLSIGLLLFLAVYLVVTPLVGGINQTDIDNLRVMFSGLGVLSKLFGVLLFLVEQPLKLRAKRLEARKG